MKRAIHHNVPAKRFEWTEDGYLCVLDYVLSGSAANPSGPAANQPGGVMNITHTEVPPAAGGKGIAADLVAAALNTARANGWRVIPSCSYAAAYIRKNKQYQDLLA